MRSWNRLITLLYCEVEIIVSTCTLDGLQVFHYRSKILLQCELQSYLANLRLNKVGLVFLYFILSLKVASIAVKIYNPSELIIFFFCNNRYVHMFGTQWKHFIVWLNCCDLFNSYTGVRTGLGFTRCVISQPKVLFVWRNN